MGSLFAGLSNLDTLIFKIGDTDPKNFDFEYLNSIFAAPNLKVLEASFYFMSLETLENF